VPAVAVPPVQPVPEAEAVQVAVAEAVPPRVPAAEEQFREKVIQLLEAKQVPEPVAAADAAVHVADGVEGAGVLRAEEEERAVARVAATRAQAAVNTGAEYKKYMDQTGMNIKQACARLGTTTTDMSESEKTKKEKAVYLRVHLADVDSRWPKAKFLALPWHVYRDQAARIDRWLQDEATPDVQAVFNPAQ